MFLAGPFKIAETYYEKGYNFVYKPKLVGKIEIPNPPEFEQYCAEFGWDSANCFLHYRPVQLIEGKCTIHSDGYEDKKLTLYAGQDTQKVLLKPLNDGNCYQYIDEAIYQHCVMPVGEAASKYWYNKTAYLQKDGAVTINAKPVTHYIWICKGAVSNGQNEVRANTLITLSPNQTYTFIASETSILLSLWTN
jgi:hypothetical protein